MIPIQSLALGEEVGRRGYLLGFQIEKYGKRKAVCINGFEWELAHLPLVYFGFNYSLNNPGAPYTNMALMLIVCVSTGILFSYITIQTGNCMYAAIMHGVVNVIGELPVYMTHDMENGLLGPNPMGILTISFYPAAFLK
ncbi:MAG: CPBP family intramembrane metalloprotease [Clostridiales bacterium]|nr:CPBP family intramembrane metalloprotease [Clostridiales bacterium]